MRDRRKKVLGIVGSPRRKGNTHLLVAKILEGAEMEGADTELVFLSDLNILECDGCHSCWKGNPCVKDDDMNRIYAKIAASDILVFGTPVYWYGPTALMKGAVDRLVYFNCPQNREGIRNKLAILAVPFEEESLETADLLVTMFERCFSYLEMELAGKVLVPGVTKRGEIKKKTLKLKEAYELGRSSVRREETAENETEDEDASGTNRRKKSGIQYFATDEKGLDEIRHLWIQLNEHHHNRAGNFRDEYERMTFDDRKQYFTQILRKGGTLRVDCARDPASGRCIGYCVTSLSGEKEGVIESIFLEIPFRSRGIGSSLMRRAVEWMDSSGSKKKWVKVADGNEDAWSFYGKFGFYPRMTVLEQKRID